MYVRIWKPINWEYIFINQTMDLLLSFALVKIFFFCWLRSIFLFFCHRSKILINSLILSRVLCCSQNIFCCKQFFKSITYAWKVQFERVYEKSKSSTLRKWKKKKLKRKTVPVDDNKRAHKISFKKKHYFSYYQEKKNLTVYVCMCGKMNVLQTVHSMKSCSFTCFTFEVIFCLHNFCYSKKFFFWIWLHVTTYRRIYIPTCSISLRVPCSHQLFSYIFLLLNRVLNSKTKGKIATLLEQDLQFRGNLSCGCYEMCNGKINVW